jgi:TP901 family phage tail tape measure protein
MSKFVLTAQLQLQAPNNVAQVVRQIQSQLNNVSVNIQVQGAAQAQRQIQQVSQTTNDAASAAERMGKAFAVSIRRFAAFSIATRAVGLFTSTLSDSIKTAIDFERQLIKVSQVTGDSIGKLRTLTSTITKLSVDFGVSSQSLLDVSTILLQAGVSAKDTEVALKSLAKAALAPNFDSITETAEGAIAILAQFKLGVGALEDQLGSINAVAGAFAVEASDLIDVIRRTGGVFKSSGGDLNELLALFTSVRATTRESAESIGTGLRTIFTRIQRPKTIEYLKQFGVELTDLNGKFVGPYEAVRQLSSAIAGLGEGDVTFIRIAEELGGFRQIGKVLPLLQQFQTAEAALNVATKANNSLTKDAAIAQESLAIRIVKVKEEFLALVRSVTETTTFQVMANTALTLASALIKIADAIKPLLPLLAAVASFRALSGIGKFVGSVGTGLASGKTFNKGGQVHRFASGGLVPGVGNGDTVPAMLSPGEFVIRKSSVQKLGASNLAGMNSGGVVQKFAFGGQARKFGVASLSPIDKPLQEVSGEVPIDSILSVLSRQKGLKKSLEKKSNIREAKSIIAGILGVRGVDSIKTSAVGESFSRKDVSDKIESRVNTSIEKLINNAAYQMKDATGIAVEKKADSNLVKSVGTASTMGSIFEGALALLGAPMDSSKREQDPVDFPSGLGPKLSGVFSSLTGIPVDAKRTADADILKDTANRKSKNYFANVIKNDPRWQQFLTSSASSVTKTTQRTEAAAPASLSNIPSGQPFSADELKSQGFNTAARNRYFSQNPTTRRWTKRVGFATGGGVGTDTVPAMLTPGEFVVNRSSAQRIGYGNLNRMNKVGKYANGGIVQHFKKGGTASSGQGAFGLAIGVSAFEALLPAVQENSGAFTKATHSILQLITTFSGLVFALDAFGLSLKGMFTASSVKGFKDLSQSATIFGRNVKNIATTTFGGKLSREWQTSIQRLAAGTAQLVAPFAATATAGYIVAKSIYAFSDSINKLDKAIQSGNIAEAEKNSTRARTESLGVGVSAAAGGLATAGLVATGALAAPIAIPIGVLVAALTAFGLQTEFASDALQDFKSVFGYATAEQAKANDRLAASTAALQEANKQASEIAVQALQDVGNGALTLDEAFAKTEKANLSNFQEQLTKIDEASKTNINKIKSETVVTSGPSIMSPYGSVPSFKRDFNPQIPQKVKQEEAKTQELAKKDVLEYLKTNQPLLKEQMIRSASGQSGVGDFTGFLSDLEKTSSNASAALGKLSDTDLVAFKNEFKNISQAVLEAQKAFDALNLGLSLVKSNIAASSVSVSNFTSSLEFGSSELQRSLDTLNASANGAGESLKSDQIDQALNEVSDNLKRFGADSTQVKKFQDNFRAISAAQRDTPKIFERLKANLGGLTGIRASDPASLRTAFEKSIKEQFKGADPAITENILNSLTKLSPQQLEQIRQTGDLSAFTDLLSESAKAQLEQVKGIEEVIKINKELSDLTKNRIEIERKFIEAQKEAISIQLEVRDLESKYGGKFLSDAEKRSNLFAKANTGTPEGISPLVTGSPEELQKRNQEIKQRFLAIEALKQEVANKKMSARDAGMVDAEGEKLKAQYEDLQKANKDQIQTIRDLIKLQEDELRIIKEKNKLEQDSIESLIRGDLEKFLEQQAAVGATAAIATGSQRLMNAYGADALSGAFADLKRQSEAGVQTAYGQQISGPGGLLEQAARYTLEQRGVNDPILAARVAANTTSAIETKNAEIRTTAAVLNAAGQTAVDMSRAQLNTADFAIKNANISIDQSIVGQRTQVEPAPSDQGVALFRRGGTVYANNGMFVPRGSDTIPAMLTPGEFVVRREAVNRGNNLQMLQAMNRGSNNGNSGSAIAGFARGGKVQYLKEGGQPSGSGFIFDPTLINRLASSLDRFNTTLSTNIEKLSQIKFHIVLDTTNINVNLTGASFLSNLTEDLKRQLYEFIGQQFSMFGVSNGGRIKKTTGVIPK